MHFSNRVLGALTASDRSAIAPDLTEVRLAAGQTLYVPQSEVESVYFPGSAILSVVTVFRDGRSAEALTIGNESAAGIIHALTSGQARSRIVTQCTGQAMRMPAARLRSLTGLHPTMLLTMLGSVQQDFGRGEHAIACNALHSAIERLARWLLMAQDRVGVGAPIIITQEALALALGIQRTTVTHFASQLRKTGAIRYARGTITVLDRGVLERLACNCYAAFEFERGVAA